MKQHSKLRHEEQQETQSHETHQQVSETVEFGSVEELLRFDAAQNPAPAAIAMRVNQSASRQTGWTGWLRRLFGR